MDLVAPLLPALVLGTVAQLLRGRWRVWWTPLVVFALSFLYLYASLGWTNPCASLGADMIEVEICTASTSPWKSLLFTSVYLGILAFIFHLVAKGLDGLLESHVKTPWFRTTMVTYITLLLLQLWIEVFPWTAALPYRFS